MAEKKKEKAVEEVVPVAKIDSEDLDNLRRLKLEYNQLMIALGEVQYNKRNLQPQLDELNRREAYILEQLDVSQQLTEAMSKEISDKYGDGQIDLETGSFTPTTD